MEITKEKFIETFKKECEKAIELIKPECFRATKIDNVEEVEIEINERVSFYLSKTTNLTTFSYCGKIILGRFVDYKSLELTEEEFESLYDFHYQCETQARLAFKNKTIKEGELALFEVLK